MSLSNEAVQSHSIKKDHNGTVSQSIRLGKAGREQSRKIRLTVSLPSDLVDRLRDAVYWSPSLTLAWLIAQSLRIAWQRWNLCTRVLSQNERRGSARGALDCSVRQ
jgi:hypothetical protein